MRLNLDRRAVLVGGAAAPQADCLYCGRAGVVQRMLNAVPVSPAYVKTPAWGIVAQNAAAAAVLTDYHA